MVEVVYAGRKLRLPESGAKTKALERFGTKIIDTPPRAEPLDAVAAAYRDAVSSAMALRFLTRFGFRLDRRNRLFVNSEAAKLFDVPWEDGESNEEAFIKAVIALGPEERLRRALAAMLRHSERFNPDWWPPGCSLRNLAAETRLREHPHNTPRNPDSNRSKKAALPQNVEKAARKAKLKAKREKRHERRVLAAVEARYARAAASGPREVQDARSSGADTSNMERVP